MADSAAQKKPGFIARAKKFFKDIKGETKKGVWPDKKQIVNNTGIVIVMVVIAAVFVGCLDLIAKGLLDLFVKLL